MKLAIVIEHFDATRGAAEHLAVWLAHQMQKSGHEVHVLCHDVAARINRFRQATLRASFDKDQSHRAQGAPDAHHEGIHIHRLRGMRLNTAFGFRLFGLRARRWTAANRMDVVHSFTVACPGDVYHSCAGVYAAIQKQAAATRATPTAAVWKRLLLKLPGKQRTLIALERRAVSGRRRLKGARVVRGGRGGAKRIISLCPMMSAQFIEHYGDAARKKLLTLQTPRLQDNGGLPSESAAAERRAWIRGHYGIGPAERVALFVGHDFRRKGLRYAIHAIARTQNWKLLIVGMGRTREYVEMIDDLHLGFGVPRDNSGGGPRVLFVGPTREMESIYAAGDALLLPAFYEPSSLVPLEALSHGLPVISTAFLGAADLVQRHNAGTIVPSPRDIDLMAAALSALPDPESTAGKSLARRAEAAAEEISPDRFLEKLAELYQQVRTG
ncbi:MAG TPA: glycosyltransferase family 4 protein [Phycisphaerae bacterium]|jgi:glycosyltransferase involved in cell wall biosynthesis|nr:glycosyltransferase family 4 protein [Phycisphaerae bacterium]